MFKHIRHLIRLIFFIERTDKLGLKFTLPDNKSIIQLASRQRGYNDIDITVSVGQRVTVHIVNIKDFAGLNTTPATSPKFRTTNPKLVSIITGTDGISATFVAKAEGVVPISVEVDDIAVTNLLIINKAYGPY